MRRADGEAPARGPCAEEAAARRASLDSAAGAQNISVAVRVRPLAGAAQQGARDGVGGGSALWTVGSGPDRGSLRDNQGGDQWTFDHVFGPEHETSEIFDVCVRDVVRSFCEGVNCTVFAYGQTASGKTHTMLGDGLCSGIIPAAVAEIFKVVEARHHECRYSASVSFMEIYNEKVSDLLAPDGSREVRLQVDPSGNLLLGGLQTHAVASPAELLRHLAVGTSRRHSAETRMNARSSRSHSILRIGLEAANAAEQGVRRSQLNLVDLAGSEGLRHTESTGERRREGSNINRSLLSLSRAIRALSEDPGAAARRRVSFRESKLTRILEASIGGNSNTVVVCAVSPAAANYAESRSTLEFASRAKRVQNKAKVNLCEDEASKITRLELELHSLRAQVQRQAAQRSARLLEQAETRLAEHLAARDAAAGPRRRHTLAGPLRKAALGGQAAPALVEPASARGPAGRGPAPEAAPEEASAEVACGAEAEVSPRGSPEEAPSGVASESPPPEAPLEDAPSDVASEGSPPGAPLDVSLLSLSASEGPPSDASPAPATPLSALREARPCDGCGAARWPSPGAPRSGSEQVGLSGEGASSHTPAASDTKRDVGPPSGGAAPPAPPSAPRSPSVALPARGGGTSDGEGGQTSPPGGGAASPTPPSAARSPSAASPARGGGLSEGEEDQGRSPAVADLEAQVRQARAEIAKAEERRRQAEAQLCALGAASPASGSASVSTRCEDDSAPRSGPSPGSLPGPASPDPEEGGELEPAAEGLFRALRAQLSAAAGLASDGGSADPPAAGCGAAGWLRAALACLDEMDRLELRQAQLEVAALRARAHAAAPVTPAEPAPAAQSEGAAEGRQEAAVAEEGQAAQMSWWQLAFDDISGGGAAASSRPSSPTPSAPREEAGGAEEDEEGEGEADDELLRLRSQLLDTGERVRALREQIAALDSEGLGALPDEDDGATVVAVPAAGPDADAGGAPAADGRAFSSGAPDASGSPRGGEERCAAGPEALAELRARLQSVKEQVREVAEEASGKERECERLDFEVSQLRLQNDGRSARLAAQPRAAAGSALSSGGAEVPRASRLADGVPLAKLERRLEASTTALERAQQHLQLVLQRRARLRDELADGAARAARAATLRAEADAARGRVEALERELRTVRRRAVGGEAADPKAADVDPFGTARQRAARPLADLSNAQRVPA